MPLKLVTFLVFKMSVFSSMQLKLVEFIISLCALYISGATFQWINALVTLILRITTASITNKY